MMSLLLSLISLMLGSAAAIALKQCGVATDLKTFDLGIALAIVILLAHIWDRIDDLYRLARKK